MQDSSLESNKNNILCSTLLCILLHLAPHFAPSCSASCSAFWSAFWSYCSAFWSTPPHLCSTTLFFLFSLKLMDTRFFKARAQHISWGHVRHCSITLQHCSIMLRHLHHAPTPRHYSVTFCHVLSCSDTLTLYSAPHSSPKLRCFWHAHQMECQRGREESTRIQLIWVR